MAQLGCPNRRTLKCLDQNQAQSNGGVIGKKNVTSFGKDTVTTKTSSPSVSQHNQEQD